MSKKEYKYIETYSDELCKMRTNAEILNRKYDSHDYNDNENKRLVLEKLFSSLGSNVAIGSKFHCEYGKKVNSSCKFAVSDDFPQTPTAVPPWHFAVCSH